MNNITLNLNSDNGVYPRINLADSGELTIFSEAEVDYITINQATETDPDKMITGDISGKQIQWIRNNSHRYLSKLTSPGKATICQLNDQDSTKYYDGSSADLSGSEGDVFMKLPKFYYSAEETEPDVWKIGFSEKQYPGSKEWAGDTMIGAYEANVSGDNIRSISGVSSTGNISQEEFISLATKRGQGYLIEDWTIHCIMAFLFYAQYGTTNSQRKCGAGTNSNTKPTGQTDTLGMTDTEGGVLEDGTLDTGKNGNQGSINFWGLENWWGNKFEWISGITWKQESRKMTATITMPSGETRKAVCDKPLNPDGTGDGVYLPTQFTIGENLDLIPKDGLNLAETQEKFPNITSSTYHDTNYGFSDGCAVLDTSTSPDTVLVVYRSNDYSYSYGGVAISYAEGDSSIA